MRKLKVAVPDQLHLGEGTVASGAVPTGPHGGLSLHPSCRSQHCTHADAVHWPNPQQDPDRPGEKWSFCQGLVQEPLQLRPHGFQYGLPGGEWVATASPAIVARLWMSMYTEAYQTLINSSGMYPGQIGQWPDGRVVHGWQYAVVQGHLMTVRAWHTCPTCAWVMWRPARDSPGCRLPRPCW